MYHFICCTFSKDQSVTFNFNYDYFINANCLLVFAGIGLYRLLVYICGPLALIKALISIVHLIAASYNCKQLDIEDRRAAKKQN